MSVIDPQPHSGHVSLFTLKIHAGENPDWPVVRVLVDGSDLVREVAPGWLGFDPDDILGPASPLLPGTEGRRVAVYRCSCGEAGCGTIAPVIESSPDQRHVLWQDFQDYVGVFFRPLATTPDTDLTGLGRPWKLPDLRFDARQYADEIARTSQDRTWESPGRRTARFLHGLLAPLDLRLPPDLPLREVLPAWEGTGVAVRFGREYADGTLDQQELRLTSANHDPARAARDIADQLRSTSPDEWLLRFSLEDS